MLAKLADREQRLRKWQLDGLICPIFMVLRGDIEQPRLHNCTRLHGSYAGNRNSP